MGMLDTCIAMPVLNATLCTVSCVSTMSSHRRQGLKVSWQPKPVPVTAVHPLSLPTVSVARTSPIPSCTSVGAYEAIP